MGFFHLDIFPHHRRRANPLVLGALIAVTAVFSLVRAFLGSDEDLDFAAQELKANQTAEDFWRALARGQWPLAQSHLAEGTRARLRAFAEKNGEQEVIGALFLFQKALPQALSAKSAIECHLQSNWQKVQRKVRSSSNPGRYHTRTRIEKNGESEYRIRGTCHLFERPMPSGNFIPAQFELKREEETWKILSFSIHSRNSRLIFNADNAEIHRARGE